MNAINHAVTALAIKQRWPHVPIVPLLLAVQATEIIWVVLNLVGVEQTGLAETVQSIADVHLRFMPYSHSVVSAVLLAVAVWMSVAFLLNRPRWATALSVAVLSHIVLDLAVHTRDIAVAPIWDGTKLGTGLYSIPLYALALETAYGIWCWRYFRGSRSLLMVILGFNVGALSFYSAEVSGPEEFLAGMPKLFAALIGVHIVTSLATVWYFASPRHGEGSSHG